MHPAPAAVLVALAVALAAAFLVADVVSRVARSLLRAIIEDRHLDPVLVDRPRRIVRLVIFLVTAAALVLPALRAAGYHTTLGGSPEALARWALDAGLRIILIVVFAYLTIRVGSAAARRFEREMSTGSGLDLIERAKRAQTLGRLLQKTLSIVVTGIAGLMILRELDVDITPVLTGAGIVGLAVGFGAQTLVRDVISGFFVILENQVRVGDVVVVNDQGGLVEEVNLRTIVLRDEEGTVHVFPNGEIKTLANKSKDFSFYILTVPVSFDDDPDVVTAALSAAGEALMHDPAYRPHILAPLDIYGVDSFDNGQLTVKARIKTAPLKQWFVGRALRHEIARVFRERKIHLPTATMRVTLDQPASAGRAEPPAAR